MRSDNNKALIRDFHSYRNRRVNDVWIDQPMDPQEGEHTMDALRYFFVHRMRPREIKRVGVGAS